MCTWTWRWVRMRVSLMSVDCTSETCAFTDLCICSCPIYGLWHWRTADTSQYCIAFCYDVYRCSDSASWGLDRLKIIHRLQFNNLCICLCPIYALWHSRVDIANNQHLQFCILHPSLWTYSRRLDCCTKISSARRPLWISQVLERMMLKYRPNINCKTHVFCKKQFYQHSILATNQQIAKCQSQDASTSVPPYLQRASCKMPFATWPLQDASCKTTATLRPKNVCTGTKASCSQASP